MLFRMGWSVTVSRKTSDHLRPARSEEESGAALARWYAEIDGVDWVEQACASGEAVQLVHGWCPGVFTMPARVLSGVVAGEVPPGCQKTRTLENNPLGDLIPDFIWHADVAAQVSPDEWLILMVLDTS